MGLGWETVFTAQDPTNSIKAQQVPQSTLIWGD